MFILLMPRAQLKRRAIGRELAGIDRVTDVRNNVSCDQLVFQCIRLIGQRDIEHLSSLFIRLYGRKGRNWYMSNY
jgi:hypothetical protein